MDRSHVTGTEQGGAASSGSGGEEEVTSEPVRLSPAPLGDAQGPHEACSPGLGGTLRVAVGRGRCWGLAWIWLATPCVPHGQAGHSMESWVHQPRAWGMRSAPCPRPYWHRMPGPCRWGATGRGTWGTLPHTGHLRETCPGVPAGPEWPEWRWHPAALGGLGEDRTGPLASSPTGGSGLGWSAGSGSQELDPFGKAPGWGPPGDATGAGAQDPGIKGSSFSGPGPSDRR